MQQMMQSVMSNPAMMEMAVNSDPRMRAMIDANPHMRQMLQNPQMLQVFTRFVAIRLPLTLFAVDDEPPVASRYEPGSAAGTAARAIFCSQSLFAAWLHSELFSLFFFKVAFLDGQNGLESHARSRRQSYGRIPWAAAASATGCSSCAHTAEPGSAG